MDVPAARLHLLLLVVLLPLFLTLVLDIKIAIPYFVDNLASHNRTTGMCSAQTSVTPFPTSFWMVKPMKIGGTTIASVLRQVCARYGIVTVRKRFFNPLQYLSDARAAAELTRLVVGARNSTDGSEFAIITHLNFSEAKLDAFQRTLDGRRPLLFTAVRHPLARTYSHFIQEQCGHAAAKLGGLIRECDRNTTYLEKLLERDSISNRWSFVQDLAMHNYEFNYVRGNTTTVEAALAQYDFVFVTERMDEGLVMFMLQYGLELHDIAYLPAKVRKGKYLSAERMPAKMNAYVMSSNHQDLLLWQHANKLLDQRRQQIEHRCGSGVVITALTAFQGLQAEVSRQCADVKAWYAANRLPEQQYTYVNDEGWGWRCVRHVAEAYVKDLQAPSGAAITGED